MQITLYGYVGYFGREYTTSFSPYHKDSEHFDGAYIVDFPDDAGLSFSRNDAGEFLVELDRLGVYVFTDVLRSVDDEPAILIPSPIGRPRYIKPVKVQRVQDYEQATIQ